MSFKYAIIKIRPLKYVTKVMKLVRNYAGKSCTACRMNQQILIPYTNKYSYCFRNKEDHCRRWGPYSIIILKKNVIKYAFNLTQM